MRLFAAGFNQDHVDLRKTAILGACGYRGARRTYAANFDGADSATVASAQSDAASRA